MLFKDVYLGLKKVFSNLWYVLLLISVALAFYILNVFIKNFGSVVSIYHGVGFFSTLFFICSLVLGFRSTVTQSSFVSLIILSILFGVFFSLLVFKFRMGVFNRNSGILGSIGVALGIIAPGCAACGIGLAAVFGVTGTTLSFLPLKGLEISIVSTVLLLFSIIFLAKDLLGCKITKRK